MSRAATHPGRTASGDSAEDLLELARDIVEDLSLETVKQWKSEHPGGLAIGHMPIYMPRPLLEAIGCLPVGIFGGGDQLDVIRGDSYFQSYICRIPRSTIELGLSGRLDVLDGMIFPSICDVIRNLSGMWQILFPDRYVAYLDLPQDFSSEMGGKFYASDLRRIAHDLEERGARPLDPMALHLAILEENFRRATIRELDFLRGQAPWMVRASEAYLIVRAGTALPAREHSRMLYAFLEAVRRREHRPYDNVRVIVHGAFCEQPPLDLIRALEKAGCDIVSDDFQLGLRTLQGPIETARAADPVEALAWSFLRKGVPCASRYVDDDRKGRALIEDCKEKKADGVIFAAASFCDPALLDQPMVEAALDREGIPHTSLKFAENTGQFQVIREQAGAFSDSVKLWGRI